MNLKYGNTLVAGLAALTLSAFAVPCGATATASTHSTITRNVATPIQLAQVEQQDTEETTTKQKTTEMQSGTDVAPAPAVAPDASGAVEQKHEESKTTETVNADNGMGATSERHQNEISNDSKMAPGSTESEHEEHHSSEKVDQNQ
ncbi:hypothetical protein [Candidatus Binatus sp.]|uniref:hypothetical protein n=1 Tax=Candidatus Binatus sp. TaxID=2811406 RepID=UPI003CC6650B